MTQSSDTSEKRNSDFERSGSAAKKGVPRSIWFHLHFWLGWITAIPVILVCISGGVLAFESYLRRWEFPEQYDLVADSDPMSVDEVLELYRSAKPKLVVHHLGFPELPTHAYTAYVSMFDDNGKRTGGGFVIANQYTGELTYAGEKFTISGSMKELHRHLAAGEVGRQIVAISSLILAVTCFIGLVLWWPMRGRTFARAWRRGRALDWHNAIGLVTLGPLVIMALTGVLLTYSSHIFPVLDKLQSEPSKPQDPVVEVGEDQEKLPVSVALGEIEKNFPDGKITGVQPTGSSSTPYVFFVNNDGLDYRVCMNPYTGTEMSRDDGRPKGAVSWFRKNYFKYHTLSFNLFTKSLWGTLSVAGGILGMTGVLTSMRRWQRRAKSSSSS
ncbi:PepSY-associated TM helix domain-containing protein [Bythopirellula goksoeyrii]|uniref:PepSY-associated TM helix n=1 Tax=Bythopirellula goksoeyrii TaxID=1400387 RepID=A0A5B9QFU5_9BACT|nr:PepSY-associated TM helix domain-containing protein [Bythopirellula goksoeyrii]QEG36769.1 hypothetical protein Pr1d_41050 [Bythopirellula goksoeyrii]